MRVFSCSYADVLSKSRVHIHRVTEVVSNLHLKEVPMEPDTTNAKRSYLCSVRLLLWVGVTTRQTSACARNRMQEE